MLLYLERIVLEQDKKIAVLEEKAEEIGSNFSVIDKLKEENERLKEENNNKAMNDYAHAIDESWYRELYDDYKSRCEKAIEYITSEEYYDLNNKKTGSFSEDSKNYFIAHDNLLNILQGENNDN